MTIANFKSMVAAMVNRTTAELTINTQDLLLHAINDARRAAQRLHDFELNKTEDAYLTTFRGGANWITGCKTTPGGGTAIMMKRIDEVWHYETVPNGLTSIYPRTTRVDYSYSGRFKRELSTSSSAASTNLQANTSVQEKFAYTTGVKLYVTTITETTPFKLVGIQWLDDLTDASDPDIFLTYFTDWLKWATIGALNIHLKDSERFPIDQLLVQSMFESVKSMDGTVANMGEATTLD